MHEITKLTSNIILKLLENDNLCKLLYYDNESPLAQPNLNDDQKNELTKGKIINNTLDTSTKRIHKSSFNKDLINDIRSELRIYKDFIPQNKCLARVNFYFEIIVHQAIWDTELGERVDEILFELKDTLQREDIKGIGCLEFKYPAKHIYYGKNYNGYLIMASSRIEW